MNTEEARAAVQASGLLEGLEGPHFHIGMPTAGGSANSWLAGFLATAEQPHPDFARVIMKRAGQEPREVVIAWAEYAARDEVTAGWNDTRAGSPNAVFGGECERHGYLTVFADVLAPLLEAERAGNVDAARPADPPARDWAGEIAATTDVAALDALWAAARGHRTSELERAMRAHRRQLTTPPPVETAAMPAPQPTASAAARPTAPARPTATPRPPRPDVPQLADTVKPAPSRKASSRAERDSGRRGGGRR